MDAADTPTSAPSRLDPVTEAYKRDIDRSLLRENLRLSPQERIQRLSEFVDFLDELRTSRRKTIREEPV